MRRAAWSAVLASILLSICAAVAGAGWEAGTKAGFDTNLSRSVRDGKGDGYLSAYAGYSREPSGETRLDWIFAAVAEGTIYARLDDLDSAAITVSPGLLHVPWPGWSVTLAPFLQAKSFRDTAQSAVAFGGKAQVKQRVGEKSYLAESYAYTDSRASNDTFSFTEHALGALVGVNWTPRLATEAGYEFSRGDSFRSVGTVSPSTGGMGGFGGFMDQGMFSSAFGTEVVKERVNRHAIGLTATYEWSRSIAGVAGYNFSVARGDLGSSNSHSGFVGLGYRF